MENNQALKACPVCSAGFKGDNYKRLPYPAASNSNEAVKKPSSIVFCANCGIGIAFPGLTDVELGEIYFHGYYPEGSKAEIISARAHPGHYVLARARWDFISPFIERNFKFQPLSILDIGGGHGFFGAAAAQNRALRLEKYCVVEKDETLRGSLEETWRRKFSKVEFTAQDLLEKVKGKYSLIVFSHILEHLNDPKGTLEAVASMLTEGGLIFVDVPNQDYIFKRNVFPHLFFFNRFSLEMLLKRSGLTIEKIGCYGRGKDESVLNYKNKRNLAAVVEKILYKTRRVLPRAFLSFFFFRHLGAGKENFNGTWLRAAARVTKESE